MKINFLLISLSLFAAPIKVPNHMYAGSPNLRDHPGHYPFISYLTYRNECDHIIDQQSEWFDPDTVKQGDLIYLNAWYLDWFVKYVHDAIPVPYLLFTGDVGGWFPHPDHQKLLYDPKLAAWFCRNLVFSYHPKLFQAPMGQDLALFHYGKELYNQLISAVVHKDSIPKKHLLYMCFYPRNDGDRDRIAQMFHDKPYCYSINHSPDSSNQLGFTFLYRPLFYADMAASYFTLSPLGLETDCVRTWEALVLNCIPIVEHTFLDPIFEGLPVFTVHDWEEITPELLEQKKEELKPLKLDKAYFDYWADILRTTQKKVRENDLSFAELEATQWKKEDLADLVEILSPLLSIHYKGFLSVMRPFTLAEALPSLTIYLEDPWLNDENFIQLFHATKSWNVLKKHTPHRSGSHFLDLTYYRTSLDIDFSTSVCKEGNFRHSFKKDLTKLYHSLEFGELLCGNQVNDPYVKKVLKMFSQENDITIQTKGSFWYFTKEKKVSTLQQILPDSYPEVYTKNFIVPSNLIPLKDHDCVFKNLTSDPIHIVEIGAWHGCTTRHFAELIPNGGKIFAVYDWTDPISFQQFLSNMMHEKLTEKVIPVRMSSHIAARKLAELDIPIDLVYIDSTNEPLDQTLEAWYPVAKGHGILCGDDWSLPKIQQAVTQFAREKNLGLFNRGDLWVLGSSF